MTNEDEPYDSILYDGNKLQSIVSDYAEIWADVLCDKNLQRHLKGIEFDILLMNVMLEFYHKKNNDRFLKILNDLNKLRDIIQTKIKK